MLDIPQHLSVSTWVITYINLLTIILCIDPFIHGTVSGHPKALVSGSFYNYAEVDHRSDAILIIYQKIVES